MMNEFNYPPGATPLNPDETEGLIPTNITTREELDRWEQDNINEALIWLEKQRLKDVFCESFMKKLHKKMFGNVWKWAGTFRQSGKTIGTNWYNLSVDLKNLCDDVQFLIDNKTFSQDEIAVRFHHRLVSIHLFPNGNGRHARLMTDILLEYVLNRSRFTWGSADLSKYDEDRKIYIDALHAADKGDYQPLMVFARS